ncbi:MAG: hypothetical protein KGO96_07250 [Elusimicrobia bacterium]|nr:hypothetical protein [Elusimicrobiota bacterium]
MDREKKIADLSEKLKNLAMSELDKDLDGILVAFVMEVCEFAMLTGASQDNLNSLISVIYSEVNSNKNVSSNKKSNLLN